MASKLSARLLDRAASVDVEKSASQMTGGTSAPLGKGADAFCAPPAPAADSISDAAHSRLRSDSVKGDMASGMVVPLQASSRMWSKNGGERGEEGAAMEVSRCPSPTASETSKPTPWFLRS